MTSTQSDFGNGTEQSVVVQAQTLNGVDRIEAFANSNKLPTLPEIALKLVELAQQDEPDYREVCRVIRADPVVSGKVLKTVNSALFGFRQRVQSIEEAVPKLGVSLLRTLILSFHLASFKTQQSEVRPVMQSLWRSSLTQAVVAELIAEQLSHADPPTYFLAGMLQDIGVLAMLVEAPDEYTENVLSEAQFPDVASAERSHFGFSHVDVSVAILSQWDIGANITAAVRSHHYRVMPPQTNRDNSLAVALQAASLGTSVLSSPQVSKNSLDSSLRQWLGFLQTHFKLTSQDAEGMVDDVKARVDEYSALFSFQINEGVQTEEVILEAKTLLQDIALNNHLELITHKSPSRRKKLLDQEVYRDYLSGLYNRRFMNEQLNEQIEQCVRKRKPIACLFLDVDKFKDINDTYGHGVGDDAIRHVARWLNASIRKNDVAIRLGGDEFLVILQNVKDSEFERIASRIANEIPAVALPNGERIDVYLSVGCTYYTPERGDVADANWLIDQADKAMYRAKKNGGNAITILRFVGQDVVS
ncbi:MAG: GGDEF domain-containing protein [Planctomycetales bacterium]|nr:GGDEF domain-containing protein [Planctomycetales bacterium]